MSPNNGSYSYSNPNPNAYQYQYPPGYNPYPQGYQQTSTSTPSYASYSRSTAMIPTGSQDSSGSSDSTNSTSTYPSSYNVSPTAYSPNGTYGYNSSQLGYLAPSHGHGHGQYYPTAHPTSSNNTPAQQSKSPSTSTSTRTSKPTQGICLYPGCPRQFARAYDLERHMKVHFPDPTGRLDCPYAGEGSFCKRVGERGFTRKDHWSEHLRNVHMVDLPKSARGTRNP
ncbi:MAG: hypothetical protein LQ349_001848 [Xanthoria aureola]|nr:MAG: hypothetical protein LQ349_001848 [Xanthoria aureola]